MDTLMPILIAGGMLAVVGLTAMGVGIAVGLLDEWRLRRDEKKVRESFLDDDEAEDLRASIRKSKASGFRR